MTVQSNLILLSLFYFLLAGLFEIGGGYLVWLWLREGKSLWLAVGGAALLVLYGIVPTLQPAHFGRVYAAYGGVFIILSLLWGWQIDKTKPDAFDLLGGLIALIGVFIIMYWPRS
ncbi:MAG: YnfA family protein [Chloroflexi bacterium]|nr:YnfA family protein [Chloroflexota bacterium]MCI0579398.1 YnfA family protein [Chloroflexota bacterium]MCI0643776.1 YnfA family protein [Chloroflexota bacterium]MCI0730036.1 YnfA family protein [Chloroflexota bacterium]